MVRAKRQFYIAYKWAKWWQQYQQSVSMSSRWHTKISSFKSGIWVSCNSVEKVALGEFSISYFIFGCSFLGGQTSIRPYWRCYYSNTDAIIYVVDSADRDRIGISKDELLYMLRVSQRAFRHCWFIMWIGKIHSLVHFPWVGRRAGRRNFSGISQ